MTVTLTLTEEQRTAVEACLRDAKFHSQNLAASHGATSALLQERVDDGRGEPEDGLAEWHATQALWHSGRARVLGSVLNLVRSGS